MKSILCLITLITTFTVDVKTLYVCADGLLDVKSGKLIPSPVVVIEDGIIKQRTTTAKLTIPEQAEHIKLTGQTLLPDLMSMDMHVHRTSNADADGYKRLAIW